MKINFLYQGKEQFVPLKTELTPCSVSQLWIFTNFSKNQHVSHTADIHFRKKIDSAHVLSCLESLKN